MHTNPNSENSTKCVQKLQIEQNCPPLHNDPSAMLTEIAFHTFYKPVIDMSSMFSKVSQQRGVVMHLGWL